MERWANWPWLEASGVAALRQKFKVVGVGSGMADVVDVSVMVLLVGVSIGSPVKVKVIVPLETTADDSDEVERSSRCSHSSRV